MIISEQEINSDVAKNEELVEQACELLKGYRGNIRDLLTKFVCALCEVEEDALCHNTKDIDIVRARWLYFYAYRFLTEESFATMSSKIDLGKGYSPTGVTQGVAKMSMLVDNDPIWRKRWAILKRLIKSTQKMNIEEMKLFPQDISLKLVAPRGVNIEIVKQEQ